MMRRIMKGLLALAALLATAVPAWAQHAVGEWNGKLAIGAISLRIGVSVKQAEDGLLSGALTSPDQGPGEIPLADISFEGTHFAFAVPSINGRYDGSWDAEKGGWTGTWTQGSALPLVLLPGKVDVVRRPQAPKPPFPYAEREVSIDSVAGVRLACTLTMPPGDGPFPAAVLATGSGAQDRDETLLAHKPFAVLADYLTRAGIAVLRCDDRGTAKSTGSFATALTRDFADDAGAAVAWLRGQPGIGKVGLIGHSEGGVVGPMVAERDPELAFLVMLAGPGTPLAELLAAQNEAVSRSSGLPADQAARQAAVTLRFLKALTGAASDAEGEAAARQILVEAGVDAETIKSQMATATTPWFRALAAYDPRPSLAKLRIPLLAINGSNDTQVPAKPNLDAIREATKGDRDVTIVELPGLNHLFQTSATGAPGEYGTIEETFAPAALKLIGDWILAHR